MILVIGNGESRQAIDINRINMKKVGCNAIYRDCYIDHLICVDKRMIQEAVDNNYNDSSKIYTRSDWFDSYSDKKNIRNVPTLPFSGYERWDLPWHWGAGPYAVLLATKHSDTIHMVGFDLHSKDQFTNNVYKDSTNYNAADKRAVDPSYWIHQIGRLFEYFSNHKFIIHQEEHWVRPKEWKKSNVMVDNMINLYYN
tara:strand:- start:72 stop:662 length:591 start_codon:yes stop_codon:yes gene_type:complete